MKIDLTDFLENEHGDTSRATADLAVLPEAGKYGATVQNLENPKKKSENINRLINKVHKEEMWAKLDVNLSDVINMVFASADYPVLIVQDDYLVYANKFFFDWLKIDGSKEFLQRKFLELVYREDWDKLVNNIGEMLTNHEQIAVRFNGGNNKIQEIKLRAIYLPDIEHFSFVLLGEKIKTGNDVATNVMYDDNTGLPSFFLFEDRLKWAILAAREQKNPDQQSMIAVMSINIDNAKEFKSLGMETIVLKRLADNLAFNLPKSATISLGLKYHFWILFTGYNGGFELDYYVRRIKEILDEGVIDNFMHHKVKYSMGCSVFGQGVKSAKEMINGAIEAVHQAQLNENEQVVFYDGKRK